MSIDQYLTVLVHTVYGYSMKENIGKEGIPLIVLEASSYQRSTDTTMILLCQYSVIQAMAIFF